MNNKMKKWILGSFVVMMIALLSSASAAVLVEHSAVLGGKVASQGLVNVGDTVKEGQALVNVETMAGVAPTSRSKVNGVVAEVLVTPGTVVKSGQIVVRIEPKTP